MEKDREILVCLTFREFDDSVNTQIMWEFLEGLKCQTYQNFRLIVTNFREKKVKSALKKSGLPFEFHQSKRKDCLYCWTEVVGNGFEYLKKGEHILLWSNIDNIFDPNFFEEIIKNFEPGIAGTSHPHLTYASFADYKKGIVRDFSEQSKEKKIDHFWELNPNYWVPDTVFVDGDVMLKKKNQKVFFSYLHKDRHLGIVQTLCLPWFADRMINLVFKTKIHLVQNARSEEKIVKEIKPKKKLNEKKALEAFNSFHREEEQNSKTIISRYCREQKIPKRYWRNRALHKINQHYRYRPVGNTYQKVIFEMYYIFWTVVCLWKDAFLGEVDKYKGAIQRKFL